MSPPGRPKGEFRSAQHEGNPVSPPGRPKGEYRSAQHEGTPVIEQTLQACMDRHLAHAAMVVRLDDELGTHHGLSWADFVLLTALDAAPKATPAKDLARTLCMPASRLLLQLLPLEKIGLVERAADSNGKRRVKLHPQGRRILREARDTAENACVR